MWLGVALLPAAWTPRPLRLPELRLLQPERTSPWGGSTSPWHSAAAPSPRHMARTLAPRTFSHAISHTLSRRDATAAAARAVAAVALPLALVPLAVPRAAAAAAPTAGATCDKKTAKRLAATAELLDLAVQVYLLWL